MMIKTDNEDSVKKKRLTSTLIVLFILFSELSSPFLSGRFVLIHDVHTFVMLPLCVLGGICFVMCFREGLKTSVLGVVTSFTLFFICVHFMIAGHSDFVGLYALSVVVILISYSMKLYNRIPYRIIIGFGVFAIIGILFQILFQPFYNEHIAPLFLDPYAVITWSTYYGYSGFFYQVGDTSFALLFAEGVCIASFFSEEKKKKVLFLFCAIVLVIFIALTGKRATTAIAVIVPILVLIINKRTRRFGIFLALALLLVTAAFVLILIKSDGLVSQSYFLGRIQDTVLSALSGSDFTSTRIALWRVAIDLFRERPIFGNGITSFRSLSGMGTDPHNIYLQSLCEMGIVGFLLLVATVFWNLLFTVRVYNRDNRVSKIALSFSLFAQIEFMIDGFFENCLTNEIEIMMYVISIGIVHSIAIRNEYVKSLTITKLLSNFHISEGKL